jgi:hypothetical protein
LRSCLTLCHERSRKYVLLDQTIDYIGWYAGISEQIVVAENVVAAVIPEMTNSVRLLTAERPTAS